MNNGQLVLAYHGCDITTRDDLVRDSSKTLRPSKNPYDWLGDGVYFYEADPQRALQYASYSAEHVELHLSAKAIGTPAVVGAVLLVSRWLDMTTQTGIGHFKSALKTLEAGFSKQGEDLPRNRPAFVGDTENLHRAMDRAVFETLHSMRHTSQQQAITSGNSAGVMAYAPFQAVRGAFHQGAALNQHSAIHGQSHIQIALRDSQCVKGWFLAPGDRLCTPDEYAQAQVRLEQAQARKTAAKPRKRV